MFKEAKSDHFYNHNNIKAEHTENQWHGELRLQGELPSKTLERQANIENCRQEQFT